MHHISLNYTMVNQSAYNVATLDLSCTVYFTANCASPIQLLNERVVITNYSPPAIEGTNISFSCPPGLVPTGPSTSMCMGNGEWEPDPSQVRCNGKDRSTQCNAMHTYKLHTYVHTHTNTLNIVDCGTPLSTSDDTIRAVYNSTLEGSQLELSCRDTITAAVCSPSGMWIPDPNIHMCRSITSDSDSSGIDIIIILL